MLLVHAIPIIFHLYKLVQSNDLFLSIQVNTNINSMINYLNQTQIKFKVDDRNITNFILSFVDDNGSYINFNNSDSYITFQIDIEYIETLNKNAIKT